VIMSLFTSPRSHKREKDTNKRERERQRTREAEGYHAGYAYEIGERKKGQRLREAQEKAACCRQVMPFLPTWSATLRANSAKSSCLHRKLMRGALSFIILRWQCCGVICAALMWVFFHQFPQIFRCTEQDDSAPSTGLQNHAHKKTQGWRECGWFMETEAAKSQFPLSTSPRSCHPST
jgi:hypothetical protein